MRTELKEKSFEVCEFSSLSFSFFPFVLGAEKGRGREREGERGRERGREFHYTQFELFFLSKNKQKIIQNV